MPTVPKALSILCLLVAACTVATTASQASEPSSTTSTADSAIGASLVEQCRACHTLERGGKKMWGPNLFGIVGRPTGSVSGYRYGRYLKEQGVAGARWNEDALREWIGDSKAVAKAAGARTKMPSQEYTDEELDDLITYLIALQGGV